VILIGRVRAAIAYQDLAGVQIVDETRSARAGLTPPAQRHLLDRALAVLLAVTSEKAFREDQFRLGAALKITFMDRRSSQVGGM
jgi:hypothetical protein